MEFYYKRKRWKYHKLQDPGGDVKSNGNPALLFVHEQGERGNEAGHQSYPQAWKEREKEEKRRGKDHNQKGMRGTVVCVCGVSSPFHLSSFWRIFLIRQFSPLNPLTNVAKKAANLMVSFPAYVTSICGLQEKKKKKKEEKRVNSIGKRLPFKGRLKSGGRNRESPYFLKSLPVTSGGRMLRMYLTP